MPSPRRSSRLQVLWRNLRHAHLIPINAGKAHAKDANPFFMYLCFLKVDNPNNPSPRFKGKSPGGGTYLDALMELGDNTGQVVQAIRDLGIDQNPRGLDHRPDRRCCPSTRGAGAEDRQAWRRSATSPCETACRC
jgi:hypothetical protein